MRLGAGGGGNDDSSVLKRIHTYTHYMHASTHISTRVNV